MRVWRDCPYRTFTQRRVRGKEWCSPGLISILVRQRGGVFGEKKGGNNEKCFFCEWQKSRRKEGEHGGKKEGFREGGKKEEGERGGSVVNYSRRRMRWGRRRGMGGGGGEGKLRGWLRGIPLLFSSPLLPSTQASGELRDIPSPLSLPFISNSHSLSTSVSTLRWGRK